VLEQHGLRVLRVRGARGARHQDHREQRRAARQVFEIPTRVMTAANAL
jgi:hypothetical protein